MNELHYSLVETEVIILQNLCIFLQYSLLNVAYLRTQINLVSKETLVLCIKQKTPAISPM